MPTQTDALATIYARSLYELAEAAGGEDKIIEVNDELTQIVELTRADRMLAEFLASPIIDPTRRAESLRKMLNGQVTDLTLRFLLVLNNKRRLNHLESIAAAHDSLVQERFGRVEVDVYTASPLDEVQQAVIRERVQAALGKEPVLHSYTDKSMIGGVRLRIGDQLIDGSVSGQIRRMREALLGSAGDSLTSRFEQIIQESASEEGDY